MPMELTFRELREGTDDFFSLATIATTLIRFIRTEEELRKHHRAYLDVREDMLAYVEEASEHIGGILRKVSMKDIFGKVADHPFIPAEDDEETVTISKEQYDDMVEDLLTMDDGRAAGYGLRYARERCADDRQFQQGFP